MVDGLEREREKLLGFRRHRQTGLTVSFFFLFLFFLLFHFFFVWQDIVRRWRTDRSMVYYVSARLFGRPYCRLRERRVFGETTLPAGGWHSTMTCLHPSFIVHRLGSGKAFRVVFERAVVAGPQAKRDGTNTPERFSSFSSGRLEAGFTCLEGEVLNRSLI
ncbi:hypothetical protein SODALDRAFT_72110 [Sodiomyces alkalinus F11]|uniref:Transmembrane protein n=1 Tax=Sodiomyces alkalinus (strain CBS 110278 / VKM F-3762 / F11) TaxID=1314773 RepID=A0A3N2PJY3_SODAK|nr:hypothetical protein SODALDRAFT_72110 [Sodiomyces alkalinus F11]ROT34842.1 hypothetical protein SODALDRAFT_72110 [Sodiomyces alkalinus F11]